jgi:hypothetical protein
MDDKPMKKFKVIEQVGEPYSPEGKDWTKRVYRMLENDTNIEHKLSTFSNLKVGEEVEGFIEETSNPDWLDIFRRKKKDSGYGGGKQYKADPERTRISINQTSVNAAKDIVVAFVSIAKPVEGKPGLFDIGGYTFKPLDELFNYFTYFRNMIQTGDPKKEDLGTSIQEKFDAEVL